MIRTLVVALIFWLYCYQIQCIPQGRFGKPYSDSVEISGGEISGPRLGDAEQNLVNYLRDKIQGRFGDEKMNLKNVDKPIGPRLGDEEMKMAKRVADRIQGRFSGDEEANVKKLDGIVASHLGDERTEVASRLEHDIQGRFGGDDAKVKKLPNYVPISGDENRNMEKYSMDKNQGRFGDGEVNAGQHLNA